MLFRETYQLNFFKFFFYDVNKIYYYIINNISRLVISIYIY